MVIFGAMKNTHIVIMAGGIGSRLFPISTVDHPKQFIDLLDCGKTLIQLTYERFLKAEPEAHFWIVTSARYIPFIHEQLPSIPDEQILAEPVSRNTAPCIAYACWKIKSHFPDANIIVTPSDAYVPKSEAFAKTMNEALEFTEGHSAIVCVGITPTSPHTGYGYISTPESYKGQGIVKVVEFKEKPSTEVAEAYIAHGGYYWNAGIFVWNVRTIEAELRKYSPQICGIMDELSPSFFTDDESAELALRFPICEKISIDYAVMEKSANVYMVAGHWIWSDLGSFEAIEAITGKKLH